MVGYPQLELNRQLCFPLYAASRSLTRAYAPILDEVGLTYPQYLTMLALWAVDGQRVGELARRLRLDSGTLTPLLKRLERAGLVTRERAPVDERTVVVNLTDEGRSLQAKVAHVPGAVATQLGLDVDEATQLRTLLDRILTSLDGERTP